ncbi:MAG: PAS domain S-box protein, partial [Anaerolineae bacterium]|nr:PAS domain S-box protein [Anaerolineae bacterium]
NEERFRALVEHSSDLTLVLNREATIIYASPSSQKILGYTPDELCGHSAWEFIHTDDHAQAQEGFQHRLVTPGASDTVTTLRIRHRNGEWRTMEMMGTNLLAHPLIAGIVINGHDVTERERAAHALRVSEERWRTYIEHASDFIFALDASARVAMVNDALCETLGYTVEELIGTSPLEFVAPEARASAQDALARIFRGETIDRFETVVLTRTQQRVTLEVRGRTFCENDHIVGTLHIARDITARKDAEGLLRQQAQMYRTLIENISDVIVIIDERRWIRFVSPSVSNVFGHPPADLIGADWLDLTHPDDYKTLHVALERAMHDPWHAHCIEHRLRHYNGTWRDCETIAQSYAREHSVDIVLSIRDITERKQASAALAAERNLLRTMVDAIPDSIFVKDTQGRFILNNAYHLQTLGVATQEQALGKTLFDFHPPDLAKKYYTDDQYVLTTGQPIIESEQQYLHHQRGERRWHLMTKVPLRDAQGNIVGLVGVGRDITERKKMEDELRRSRKEWQDIFNAIGHPTFILDVQHRIIAVNPAALKQLGKTENEMLGKHCYDLLHDTGAPPTNCPMETLLRTGVMQTVEMEMQTIAGTFLVSCTPVLDAQGKLEKIIHMATDVTELKRTQTELQEANARFYALVEGIPDIVYLKDTQGRNLYVNRAYEEFAGTTRTNIVGKRDDEIMPPDLATQCAQGDAQVFNTGTPIRVEESTTDRDGNLVWYETIKNPIRDASGNIIGLVGVSRDITERKRAEATIREYSEHLQQLVEARTRELNEAQEQLVRQVRLATLGQLAGSIAHELRSPLSAIKNATYYLRTHLEQPDDDTREILQILDEQVNTSARIIESLLDFARPKTPVLKRVHLPYLIQSALEQCTVPNNIAITWDVDANLPDVFLDAAQMQIVFRNLITNAIQAMPKGGQLTLGVRIEAETVCASISDTGHGIPPEALDKIFQPLYTTKAKGIGLGLALCKLIVEAHDGKISVTSQVGRGTTFTISLPANLVEGEE